MDTNEKRRVFLYGFTGEFGQHLYDNLKQDYEVCHWISTSEGADNYWSYVRVDSRLTTKHKSIKALQSYKYFYDKNFQQYLLLVQRRGEHWRDYFEVRNEFSILYYRFNDLLDKHDPNLILFANLPHEGADHILYSLAKLREINTLLFYQSLHPNKFFAMTNIKDFGDFQTVNVSKTNNIVPYIKPNLFYMKDVNNKLDAEKSNLRHQLMYKLGSYHTKLNKLVEGIKEHGNDRIYSKSFYRQANLRLNDIIYNKKISDTHLKQDDLNQLLTSEKLIYVPLHLQPELTTSALGGIYEDQLNMIEILSSETSDYTIVAKENPKQNSFQRKPLFFRRLAVLDNVEIANYDVNSTTLIEHSNLTATISGTAGWEALQLGKKCMVFGQAWYQTLPGCYRYSDISLKECLRVPNPNIVEVKGAYELLIGRCMDGVVDEEYSELVEGYTALNNAKVVSESIKAILSSPRVLW